MAIVINPITQIVSITAPQTTLTVQNFVNAVRAFEDTYYGIVYDSIIDAAGKADLGGGLYTGIVCTLNSGWQVQFWNGVALGIIYGGNLVGGVGGEPVKPTGGADTIKIINDVGGIIVVSGSGVLPADIVAIKDAVWNEPLAGHVGDTAAYSLLRALGLAQENQYIDNIVYAGDKVISMRLKVYDNAGNVGTGFGVVATYDITSVYIGDELSTYKVVKV